MGRPDAACTVRWPYCNAHRNDFGVEEGVKPANALGDLRSGMPLEIRTLSATHLSLEMDYVKKPVLARGFFHEKASMA
jgi:hypothetical protein